MTMTTSTISTTMRTKRRKSTSEHSGSSAAVKDQRLRELLSGFSSAIVAFSGGVDSAYLSVVATQVLGSGALCVTADSPSYPEHHRSLARQVAGAFALRHEIVATAGARAARVPRQSRQPLLLLQAGAVFDADGARRDARHRRGARRQQRRRSRRLSSWPPGRPRAWRAQSARRGRTHQAGDPRAVASRRHGHVG